MGGEGSEEAGAPVLRAGLPEKAKPDAAGKVQVRTLGNASADVAQGPGRGQAEGC